MLTMANEMRSSRPLTLSGPMGRIRALSSCRVVFDGDGAPLLTSLAEPEPGDFQASE